MGFFQRLFAESTRPDKTTEAVEAEKVTDPETPAMKEDIVVESDLTSTKNVLAAAIVYEGHLPADHQLDARALALELVQGAVGVGQLEDVQVPELAVVKAQRADESAFYAGDYEPGSELPEMLQQCVSELRRKLIAAGHDLGQVPVTQIGLRGRSSIASVCHCSLMIVNPPREQSTEFELRRAEGSEVLELEKAGEVSRSNIKEMDMEVYLLKLSEAEEFGSMDTLSLEGNLTCPICAQNVPVQIKQINFSGFLRADSVYHAACPKCRATTEFRGVTTGEDSEEESQFWLVVWATTGPPGAGPRKGSVSDQPRVQMESIQRS